MTHLFKDEDSARRYLGGRPPIHSTIIGEISTLIGLTAPVRRAVDVACGVGQSTVALKAIADDVVGTDSSEAMLRLAISPDSITYVGAAAEDLPFGDNVFDLMTVALALHWLDRERFLPEAGRVLVPNGWLVVYTHGFEGKMLENPELARWWKEEYNERYPRPERDRRPLSDEDFRAGGLELVVDTRGKVEVAFSPDELVAHLLSLSHITAAVESGRDSMDGARHWLREAVTPLFTGPQGTFPFEGPILCLRKASSES
jgi:SAM-dependent methyltransferase